MAQLAGIATVVSALLSIGGTAISAWGAVEEGRASQEALNLSADQDEAAGREVFAASQREANERRLEGELIMSKQLAIAAASGGGAREDAPTIMRILTKTGERAKYGSDTALYNGLESKRTYYQDAEAKRKSGGANYFGSLLRAGGTVASGAGDLLRRIPIQPSEVG